MADRSAHDQARMSSLVGRDREQAILHDHLAAALAGRGGLVLIGGEAGVGKTALADALLAEAAAQGTLVLVGHCYDLTETPPYGPWAEALARAPRSDNQPATPDLTGRDTTSQAALFAAVRDHLATLATARPLVLLLDDLHWADPASLDLLRVLGRGLADYGILLLATYRADELTRHHPLYALLPLLVREACAAQVGLRPLTAADLHALVHARYPLPAPDEARLVAYLAARAEGNPFYAGELLRTLAETGVLRDADGNWALGDLAGAALPALLGQVIDARVDRLGEAARELLTIAAIVGHEVPLALWATVAGIDEAALLETVERATAARLLGETPGGAAVRFAHALVREALYAGLPGTRRRRAHGAVAEALLAGPAPDPDAVADHLRRAGDPRAAVWLERAGVRAQRAYAWRAAAERFAAALALEDAGGVPAPGRGWLLLRLARLLRFANRRHGLAYLDEALQLAWAEGDRALGAAARCHRGLLRCLTGDVRGGLEDLGAGAEALDALSAGEVARLAAVQGRLGIPLDAGLRGLQALWLAIVGRHAEALAAGTRVVTAHPAPRGELPLDDDPRGDAWTGLGIAHAVLGQPDEARAAFAAAHALFGASGHYLSVSTTAVTDLVHATLPYAATDRAARARLAAAVPAAHGRLAGIGRMFPPMAMLAWLHYIAGDWATARAGWEAAGQTNPAAWRSTAARLALAPVAIGRIARAQGDEAAARTAVDGLLAGPGDAPGAEHLHLALGTQSLAADLALDAGDLPAALAWLEAYDRWLAWSGAVLWRAEGALGWARYHRLAGEYDLARAHAATALAHASAPHQPLAALAAHRLLGELATATGAHADAERHLAASRDLADACAAPYERALTLLALAELRAATGDRDGATTTLVAARATLESLAARPALARATALSARLAALVAPDAPGYPAGLTTREAEVLRLVAEGLSNAQVAERLFLAPRTVNTHLTNIYTKLGVDNRAAATRFALGHGLA